MALFKEELNTVKSQYRNQKKELIASQRLVLKYKDMVIAQENLITRTKLALKSGNIDSLYSTYKISIPIKCKVAMFLVHQFETLDFDFIEIVDREELLQDKLELL